MNHNVKIIRIKGGTARSVAYGDVYEYSYPEQLEIGTQVEIPFSKCTYEGEVTDAPVNRKGYEIQAIKKILSEGPTRLAVVV